MADRPEVRVHGVRELAAGSRKLADAIEQSAPHALLEAAGRAATMARGRVPKVSGRLAGSVRAGLGHDAAELSMGEGVPYAGWIEFGGTRGRPYVPQGRYLYPAAKDTEQVVQLTAQRTAMTEIGGFHWPSPTL